MILLDSNLFYLLISPAKNLIRLSFIESERGQSHTLMANDEHDKRQWMQALHKVTSNIVVVPETKGKDKQQLSSWVLSHSHTCWTCFLYLQTLEQHNTDYVVITRMRTWELLYHGTLRETFSSAIGLRKKQRLEKKCIASFHQTSLEMLTWVM